MNYKSNPRTVMKKIVLTVRLKRARSFCPFRMYWVISTVQVDFFLCYFAKSQLFNIDLAK